MLGDSLPRLKKNNIMAKQTDIFSDQPMPKTSDLVTKPDPKPVRDSELPQLASDKSRSLPQASNKPDIEIPLPKDDERFTEFTTDEMFSALLKRIKKEKARVVLQAGYAQFQEIAKRATPAYVITRAVDILKEIGDGQVSAAYILENENSDPMSEGPPEKS